MDLSIQRMSRWCVRFVVTSTAAPFSGLPLVQQRTWVATVWAVGGFTAVLDCRRDYLFRLSAAPSTMEKPSNCG